LAGEVCGRDHQRFRSNLNVNKSSHLTFIHHLASEGFAGFEEPVAPQTPDVQLKAVGSTERTPITMPSASITSHSASIDFPEIIKQIVNEKSRFISV
jgi:hypothetical protein